MLRRQLFLPVLFLAMPAQAEITVLPAVKDNTLFEDSQGSLSNGAGEFMFVGRTLSEGVRRALIAFDIQSGVSEGSTINSVHLILNMSKTATGIQNVRLHRVLQAWGEGTSNAVERGGGGGAPATTGDATWTHTFFNSVFWTSLGGDFEPTPSASIEVNFNDQYTWESTAAMVADVQAWLDDPASNFGWILIGNESTTRTAKRFDTKENLNPNNQPRLIVVFTPTTPVASRTWQEIKSLYR